MNSVGLGTLAARDDEAFRIRNRKQTGKPNKKTRFDRSRGVVDEFFSTKSLMGMSLRYGHRDKAKEYLNRAKKQLAILKKDPDVTDGEREIIEGYYGEMLVQYKSAAKSK